MKKTWWVYIAELETNVLYVGMTSDMERRERWLREGRGYVGRRGLARILWSERHADRSSAHDREMQLKGWTRAKKLALIGGDLETLRRLSIRRTRGNSP